MPAPRSRRNHAVADDANITCVTERIDYIELPGGDMTVTKSFYGSAFGLDFTDYGPTYSGFENAGLDGGLATGDAAMVTGPLVILKAEVLEDALARVEAAGGTVTAPIFEFQVAGVSTSVIPPGTNSAHGASESPRIQPVVRRERVAASALAECH